MLHMHMRFPGPTILGLRDDSLINLGFGQPRVHVASWIRLFESLLAGLL